MEITVAISALIVSAASLLIMALTGRRTARDSDWQRMRDRIRELEQQLADAQRERNACRDENFRLMRRLMQLNEDPGRKGEE